MSDTFTAYASRITLAGSILDARRAGNQAEIAATAKAYKVHRRKLTRAHHGHGEYTIDHGSLTYLMGPDGRFLTLLPRKTSPERMAAVLRKYLS